MPQIALIHDKWTDEKIEEMSLDDLRKFRFNDLIILHGIKYNIIETKRVPATMSSHNDTFFTFVYVEKSSEQRTAI